MRIRALLIAAALALASACGDDGGSDSGDDTTPDDAASALRVGRFDFDESELLAELYGQALEAAGVPVRRVDAAASREIIAPALESGQLDLVPEYLGSAMAQYTVDGTEPDEITPASFRELLAPRGLTALEPAPALNTNVFVVMADSGLGPTLSDLADAAPTLRFAGTPECADRTLCLAGLEDTYGLFFAEYVVEPATGLRAEALRRDEVDVALLFSTDASLTSDFAVLTDDRSLQPADNVVPVIRLDALDRWGPEEVTAALDGVSAALTTAELRDMNRAVADGAPPSAVAAEWLARKGLVTSS